MPYQRKNRAKFLIMCSLRESLCLRQRPSDLRGHRKALLVEHGQQIKEIFIEIANASAFAIKELEVDHDHVHLLVSSQPYLSPAQTVRRLKMESTRRIWQEHPELGLEFWKKKVFWSDG